MDLFDVVMGWAYFAVGIWCVAAVIGGLLIMLMDRLGSRAEPSEEDVKHTAALYSRHYGERASAVIADHIRAASFAPDGRYRRFLRRVSAELRADSVAGNDPAHALDR